MRTSPIDARHRALGAQMGSFAGWEMPISYAGTVGEHTAVRTDCGVFDVSHLGKILVRGDRGREVLDRALTNKMLDLEKGRARYTLMLDDGDAGIVDDMIVYGLGEDLLVVPNASNVDEVERRLRDTPGAEDLDIAQSGNAILALQGPRSREVLERVVPGAPEMTYMHCAQAGEIWLARSGYTGEHGYEIFVPPAGAAALWDAICAEGVAPCGLAARDTLRLEMGYPLHGLDIDRSCMPSEAGVMWAVGKTKGDFAGKKVLEATLPRKTLVGIRMTDRAIPRHGCGVLLDDEQIGECTSGTFSPTLKIGIALAYVRPGSVSVGDALTVDVRGKRGAGTVVDPPFVTSSPKK